MTPITYPSIAFTGKAGAGKDTAYEELTKLVPYWRYALADPLKDLAAQVWGDEARSDRNKLQQLGRKVREIDEDAWINLLLKSCAHLLGRGRVAVTDCRYPNELYRLRGEGCLIVRVSARRDQRIMRLRANGKLQDEADLDDPSETALDDFEVDYEVHNHTDRDGLRRQLAYILDRVAR